MSNIELHTAMMGEMDRGRLSEFIESLGTRMRLKVLTRARSFLRGINKILSLI